MIDGKNFSPPMLAYLSWLLSYISQNSQLSSVKLVSFHYMMTECEQKMVNLWRYNIRQKHFNSFCSTNCSEKRDFFMALKNQIPAFFTSSRHSANFSESLQQNDKIQSVSRPFLLPCYSKTRLSTTKKSHLLMAHLFLVAKATFEGMFSGREATVFE